MMNKIFNLSSMIKSITEEDDGSVLIRGMASTNDVDRVGDVISPQAWAKGGLSNFEKNPIILYNHNHDTPIGRATELKITDNGLEMKAFISKSAPNNIAQLIKEGILSTFSVGFRVKDADYVKETDGLLIKDAELFEVSVVSIPCNQAASFSIAKSFDSNAEYEEFKKTFINNNANLAGQSLAEEEVNTPDTASDASDSTAKAVTQEKTMPIENTQNVDLEAFAKKVAADTAAQIAMKHAEQKAADAKEANEKSALESKEKAAKDSALADRASLFAELEAKMNESRAEMDASNKTLMEKLAETEKELQSVRNSKKVFADRSGKSDIKSWGPEFLKAHVLGIMTTKGMSTNFATDLQEKAGIDYISNAGDIDQEVAALIEKEIMKDLRVAALFREIQVNGKSTVLPIQLDSNPATWAGSTPLGDLSDRDQAVSGLGATGSGALDNQYQPSEVIMTAHRLVSTTLMDNEVDEDVLVNLMPMLIEGIARAHARAVEKAILLGEAGKILGLKGVATTATATLSVGGAAKLTSLILVGARKQMGKYGLNAGELVYVVSQDGYYDLLEDASFQTIDEVGTEFAIRITGTVGAVFGTPVVVSDEFAAKGAGAEAAFVVNKRNYVIPRLRGVTLEQDYEVREQRRVIVGSQSLGFTQLRPASGVDVPCMSIDYVA
jgi:HK97 family phage prohead protease